MCKVFPGEQIELQGKTPFPKVHAPRNCYDFPISFKVNFLASVGPFKKKHSLKVTLPGDASPFCHHSSFGGNDVCEPTAKLTRSSGKELTYYPIFITAEYQALCSSGPGMTSAGTGKALLESWPTDTCAEAVLKPLWVSSYFGTVWPDTLLASITWWCTRDA